MALPTTLIPSNSSNHYLPINQSQVFISETHNEAWTHCEFNIWIWDGLLNGANRGEENKIIVQNLSQGREARIDIKPYILEKIKQPTVPIDATDWDSYESNVNVWVYYTYRMFNNSTIVKKRFEQGDFQWDSFIKIAGWGTKIRQSIVSASTHNLNYTKIMSVEDNQENKLEIYNGLKFPINRIPLFYTNGLDSVTNSNQYHKFIEYEAEVECGSTHMIAYINRYGSINYMPLGGKVQATFERSSDKYIHSTSTQRTESFMRNSLGDYSETNVTGSIKWNVNTPYFTTPQYVYFEDILYSPYVWLITTKTDNCTRVRITGQKVLQQKKYNKLLQFDLELEEMVKLL